jgi:hypothetical protein
MPKWSTLSLNLPAISLLASGLSSVGKALKIVGTTAKAQIPVLRAASVQINDSPVGSAYSALTISLQKIMNDLNSELDVVSYLPDPSNPLLIPQFSRWVDNVCGSLSIYHEGVVPLLSGQSSKVADLAPQNYSGVALVVSAKTVQEIVPKISIMTQFMGSGTAPLKVEGLYQLKYKPSTVSYATNGAQVPIRLSLGKLFKPVGDMLSVANKAVGSLPSVPSDPVNSMVVALSDKADNLNALADEIDRVATSIEEFTKSFQVSMISFDSVNLKDLKSTLLESQDAPKNHYAVGMLLIASGETISTLMGLLS